MWRSFVVFPKMLIRTPVHTIFALKYPSGLIVKFVDKEAWPWGHKETAKRKRRTLVFFFCLFSCILFPNKERIGKGVGVRNSGGVVQWIYVGYRPILFIFYF